MGICFGTARRGIPKEHESDILLHKAMKKSFDELGVKKLLTVKSLQAEYAAFLAEKKAAYTDYRKARNEMKELLTVKANDDHLLAPTGAKRREKKIMGSVELSMIPEASAGRAAAQFIVRSEGIGGAATSKQWASWVPRCPLLATMSLTLKQRGKSILHSGSCLSYNEGVIGLTEHLVLANCKPPPHCSVRFTQVEASEIFRTFV